MATLRLSSSRFKLIAFTLIFLLLLQFFVGLKIYYNRVYIYNIAQIYIFENSAGGNTDFLNAHDASGEISGLPYDQEKWTRTFNATSILPRENNTFRSLFTANESLCPAIPDGLIGRIAVSRQLPSYEELEAIFPDLQPGGYWKPRDCLPRRKAAIVVPYRDRGAHLHAFLYHMHQFLQKQQLEYSIYIIEQVTNQTFNRGKLLNVGFALALKAHGWQCVIFHDVDLLPEDDRNLYSCPDQPRHMSVAVDKFEYELPYKEIFGGATALRAEHFRKLNGYSNDYWGWGGEDDDMASRIQQVGLGIARYPADIARYKMIKHILDKGNSINSCRYKLNRKVKRRWKADGLSNLTYEIVSFERKRLFTWALVDLLEEESRKQLDNEKVCQTTMYPYLVVSLVGSLIICALLHKIRQSKRKK